MLVMFVMMCHVCSLGAGIVGDTLFVPSVVSQLAFNPLCHIRYVNSTLPPDEWKEVQKYPIKTNRLSS